MVSTPPREDDCSSLGRIADRRKNLWFHETGTFSFSLGASGVQVEPVAPCSGKAVARCLEGFWWREDLASRCPENVRVLFV